MRILFLAITILFFGTSFAQKGKANQLSPADKTQKFLKRWGKELALSVEQKTSVEPLILDMYTKMAAIRLDTSMQNKSKKLAMMGARKISLDGFKGFLTPEQVILYDKKVQEMAANQRVQRSKENEKNEKKGIKKEAEEEIENADIF